MVLFFSITIDSVPKRKSIFRRPKCKWHVLLILYGLLYYFQDVVEERFRTEYLIAIVVAVVLLLIISLVVTTLLAMRCQRSRAKRLRAAAIESSELQRSRSGGDLSNTDTVATQVKDNIELELKTLPDFKMLVNTLEPEYSFNWHST